MQAMVMRLRGQWSALPRRAQFAIIGVAVATILMLVFVIRASTSTTWTTVTEPGMAADKLGTAQTQLEEAGFQVQQTEAGDALQVPKESAQKAAATLMEAGIAARGGREECADLFGSKGGGMGVASTSAETEQKIKNCEQNQTANAIENMNGVESASVVVTLADESLFSDEEQPAKASVVIDTGGNQLPAKAVSGIQAAVASRFKMLKPSSVSVVDENGIEISKNAADESSDNQSKKLEIEAKYNALVEAKLTKQFEKIVGEGNVAVMSNAELDLDEIQRQVEENSLPEGGQPIVELEDYEKELLRGADGAQAGGVTGTASNTVDPDDRRTVTTDPVAADDPGAGGYASDKAQNAYAINKVRENITAAPGTVLRNRGAVVVDASVDEAAANAVSNAMQAWMGGNTQDSFSFSRAPLASAKPSGDAAAAGALQDQISGYVRWGLLGLGLIGLAFVLRRSLTQRTAELLSPADDLLMLDAGDFAPIPIAELEAALAQDEPNKEFQQRLEMQRRVEQIAESKPGDVANELRRWMHHNHDETAAYGNAQRRAS